VSNAVGTSVIGSELEEGGHSLFEDTVLEIQRKSTKTNSIAGSLIQIQTITS
jgi:hypothetical protein